VANVPWHASPQVGHCMLQVWDSPTPISLSLHTLLMFLDTRPSCAYLLWICQPWRPGAAQREGHSYGYFDRQYRCLDSVEAKREKSQGQCGDHHVVDEGIFDQMRARNAVGLLFQES